jgi:small subunit ribosomal protein S21
MSVVINVEVEIRKGESVEKLIKRFLKKVKKSKIVEEFREHCFYLKPSDEKRMREKEKKRLLRIAAEKEAEELKKNDKTNYRKDKNRRSK